MNQTTIFYHKFHLLGFPEISFLSLSWNPIIFFPFIDLFRLRFSIRFFLFSSFLVFAFIFQTFFHKLQRSNPKMFFPRLPKNFIHTLSQIFGDHLKGLFAKIVGPFTAFEPILKASLWPWWLLHVHKDTGLNPVQKYLYNHTNKRYNINKTTTINQLPYSTTVNIIP